MEDLILEQLKAIAGEENVFEKEPLKKHTTFKIGGPAKYFVEISDQSQIAKIIKLSKEKNIEYFILGNGSNMLVSDDGYAGILVHIADKFADIIVEGKTIVAKAGAKLGRIGKLALENELTGFEFASGIPGSVGGAVMMNAGAYGGEIKDILVSATVMDRDGNIKVLSNEELHFSYRSSIVEELKYIVLEATFKLDKGDKNVISETMKDLSFKRKDKQPLEYPSAGSTFKRPEGYFAAKLIDDAGLRGYSVNSAMVSQKHAGFVINTGDATCEDVIKLTEHVKNEVFSRFGVKLELEVKLL